MSICRTFRLERVFVVLLILLYPGTGYTADPSEGGALQPSAQALGSPARSRLPASDLTAAAPQAGSSVTSPEYPRMGQCSGHYPLPLATHWTSHRKSSMERSTHPDWQLEQVAAGHHWLPTFFMGDFAQPWDAWAESYYVAAIREARHRGLPIALVSTQWERVIYDRAPWKNAKPKVSALFLTTDGKLEPKLDPFAAATQWAEAGRAWATGPILQKLQELYPDPPYVVLISNNEPKRIKQTDVERSARFRQLYGTGTSEEFRRRKLGDHFIERYKTMVESFRSGLGSWKERVVLIGWGGLSIGFGRGPWLDANLPNFGLSVPGRVNIAPFAWDGVSYRYYVVNRGRQKADDFSFYSPEAESMNLPLQLEAACEQNPDFFWEMTTYWDAAFKERVVREGQQISPQRYGGFVKYGMWVTRPRVVREFSLSTQRRSEYIDELTQVMEAVNQVYRDPVLTSFWQDSELVWNESRPHPYRNDIPPEYRDRPRWLQLKTNFEPEESWFMRTEVPVWALARVQGRAGARRWLLYLQSPRQIRPDVQVTLPQRSDTVEASATPGGCYYYVEESGPARSLAVNGPGCEVAES